MTTPKPKGKGKARCDTPPSAVIYGLTDPATGELRYIGKANDAAKRLEGHMRETRRRTPLYDWLRKLSTQGTLPGLIILHECDGDWREDERSLIAEARRRGDRILNVADGGDEPFCPAEVRRENGRRQVRRLTGLEPYPGWTLSDEGFIVQTYNRVLRLLVSRGYPEKAEEVRGRMRKRYAEDPKAFGCWANV